MLTNQDQFKNIKFNISFTYILKLYVNNVDHGKEQCSNGSEEEDNKWCKRLVEWCPRNSKHSYNKKIKIKKRT